MAATIQNIHFQGKFKLHLSSSPPQQNPHHGIRVEATSIVVLNALGYIGFKVISTCGDTKVRFHFTGVFSANVRSLPSHGVLHNIVRTFK